MSMAGSIGGQAAVGRPTRAQVDVFGLTHMGKVRTENADHFLVASLHKALEVQQTSLPFEQMSPTISEPRGYILLVADGVGRGAGGEHAASTALRTVAAYVTNAMGVCSRIDPDRESHYVDQLKDAVLRSHEAVLAEASRDGVHSGMATTLTMVTVVWPRAFLIQVGDSRCYRLRDGKLELMTRDQTMAQVMLDAGAITPEAAERSGLRHVLWSAVGGTQAVPEVFTADCEWSDMIILCSDGLTKHVSDDEIRDHMLKGATARTICQELLDLALDRGGTDNVTVVVGRIDTGTGH